MTESPATVIGPPSDVVFQAEGWRLRVANTDDRPALNHLLETIPFGGPLAVTEDRGGTPDLLRAFEAQSTGFPPLQFLMEDPQGEAIGCFSIVTRRARFGADELIAGHLSDLRVRPTHRGATIMPTALRAACDLSRERTGAEVFFTGCLDYDTHAYGALTHRDERRYQQPMAQVMQQLTLALVPPNARMPDNPSRRIERGSRATLDEVGDFLSRAHAMSTLGHVLSPEAFAERLHHATSGDLERIILVRESRGTLACCGAVISTGSMRRFALGHLTGSARAQARRFGLRSWTGGYSRLPAGRGPQPLVQLGFLAQRDEDPGPLRDLLLATLSETWATSPTWLTVAIPRHGAASQVLDDVTRFKVPVALMAVTRAGTRWNNVDFRTQRSGVEHLFL